MKYKIGIRQGKIWGKSHVGEYKQTTVLTGIISSILATVKGGIGTLPRKIMYSVKVSL